MQFVEDSNQIVPYQINPLGVVRSGTTSFAKIFAMISVKSFRYYRIRKFSLVNVLDTLLFPFSNKIVVIRIGKNKMLVRIANGEDHDQTASEEAV